VSVPKRFTAVVMAGSRGAGDPLAVAGGVSHKAFVRVGGLPMLERVVTTLRASTAVERIVIVGLDPAAACAEATLQHIGWDRLELLQGGDSPAASATGAVESLALVPPVLITTADHPLLTPATVDEFCAAASTGGADVAFGVAESERVAAAFPGVRRTVHRFRDGSFCGCNLFALLTVPGCRAPQLWRQTESYRKRPWRMVALLGVPVLLRFLLGRLALAEVGEIIHARFGLRAQAVRLSDAAAGFDVDTVQQREVAERYLEHRA
jgi:GTP:adenosylcobinamide-phosphate guanylyltransferase